MNFVSVKKITKIYGVSKDEVRESTKTNTFDWIKKKNEILIDIDSFRKSKFHISFSYNKLIKIYNKDTIQTYRMVEIQKYFSDNIDDEMFEKYFRMFEECLSTHYQYIISNLEKESFTKSDYDDYLQSIRNNCKDYMSLTDKEERIDSMYNITKIISILISDELIEKYPSYYDDNFLIRIIEDIEKNNYLNDKDSVIIDMYVTLLKYGTKKGLKPIIEKIDFDKYEEKLLHMKSINKFFNRIFSDGDERYFSNIRDMFIF